MPTTIKNISLLLTRFGARTDYTCTLEIYDTDIDGLAQNLLGSVSRSAEDVDFEGWYNFVFNPALDVDVEGDRIALVLSQSISDTNNFILWHRSDETSDFEDPALEFSPDTTDYSIQRSFRIYSEYNEITGEENKVKITLPDASVKTVSFSNRQELYDGFKQNVAIVDDRVTLKDVGRRILFFDQNEANGRWIETNRNLPPDVLKVIMKSQFSDSSSNPYNCLCVASTTEGVFFSTNSGGDWKPIPNTSLAGRVANDICFGSLSGSDDRISATYTEGGSAGITYSFIPPDFDTFSTSSHDHPVLKMTTLGSKFMMATNGGVTYDFGDDGDGTYTVSDVNKLRFVNYGSDPEDHTPCIIADSGIYAATSGTFSLVTGTDDLGPCYDMVFYNGRFYIATETGVFVSDASLLPSEITEWSGQDPYKTPYLTNLKRTKTTGLEVSGSTLYVSQFGGVARTDDGVSFTSISDGLHPDTDVLSIAVNPVNEDMIHIHSRTTKNKMPFVTFIIDQSGSQYPGDTSNQGEIAAIIGTTISGSTEGARFQVIAFSYPESGKSEDGRQPKKAENLTSGFVPWSTDLNDELEALQPKPHYRTPLYEALWASLVGLYNDGSPWVYDTTKEDHFEFDYTTDDLYRDSSRIVILITDGRDNASTKTLQSILGSDSKFPGINQLDIKLYVVAYGANADLNELSSLRIPDMELLYARAGNATDSNEIATHIGNREQYRYRDGKYRRSFSTENPVRFTSITSDVSVPDDTSISMRYRTSMERYDLGDFTDYVTVANGATTININAVGQFIEVEYKLHSDSVNASPSIFGMEIGYTAPSKSTLLLNTIDSAGDERIGQLHLTLNALVQDGSGTPGHYLGQNVVKLHGKFSPSASFHESVFEDVNLDHRAIVNRRSLERTSSSDQIAYRVINGPWDSNQEIAVYRNGKELTETDFYAYPERGEIIFPVQNKASDDITITISPTDKFRLGFEILNGGSARTLYLNEAAVMYLREQETVNERAAMPLTSRQIGSSANATVSVQSLVPKDSASAVAGANAFITASHVVKFDLPSGSKMLLGFGEFTGDVFLQHEGTGITPVLQGDSASAANYVSVSTKRKGVIFRVQSHDTHGFVSITTSGSTIKKGDVIMFEIGGGVTKGSGVAAKLSRDSEFTTPHFPTENVAGALRTSLALAVKDSGIPVLTDLKKGVPVVTFTGSSDSEFIHIAAPTSPESSTISVTLTITNSLGIVADRSVATVQLSLRNLSTSVITPISDINFETANAGTKKVTVDLPGNGTYQIIARHVGSGYSTRSNAITLGGDSRIFWGDLNAKSCFGTGRQSPEFVYEYARDTAGLDFAVIADPVWESTETLWTKAQEIAADFNVEGSFVTFLGAEWKPDAGNIGRRVIVFRNDSVPELSRMATSGLASLYGNISTFRSIVFAQHPAYADSERNVNWKNIKSVVNSGIEVAVEVYSEHGNSESSLLRTNNGLITPAADAAKSYVADALQQGLRLAFVGTSNSDTSRPGLYTGELSRSRLPLASTDTSAINNRGLTAVIANNQSRQAIFDAIKSGRTYATTGARIVLGFQSGIVGMGQELEVREISEGVLEADPEFTVTVYPTSEFATLNLVRVDVDPTNTTSTMKIVKTASVTSAGISTTLTDTTLGQSRKDARYFLRVIQEDGHMGWGSPIYVKYITA